MTSEAKRRAGRKGDAQGAVSGIFGNEYVVLSLLALVVGVLGGFSALLFRWMITEFQTVFFIGGDPLSNPLGIYIILIPAIGGLIVGLLVYFFAREAKGHGVPEVMEAVAVKEGKIRPRVAAVKALASSITIGSGGSAGREGPIVQIGSTIGSTIGQKLRLPPGGTKILLACGATAGIAATFNTPIAAVIFAIELILFEFKTRSFIPLVISTVTGTIISRTFLGPIPAFEVPTYHFVSPYELVFYLLLGLIAGIVAVFFIHLLYVVEDLFKKLKIKPYYKPVIGGLAIGVMGFFIPQIFGVGYGTVDAVLNERIFVFGFGSLFVFAMYLLLLCLAKIIANSLTLGSGGSGGVFSPSLFIGAMMGGAFGVIVHFFYPDITATYGAYALVGMAAVFAGVSRGTLTAIIIVFEMTLDYNIILPLMFACVIADTVSSLMSKETIYTRKLLRKGVSIRHDMEVPLLSSLYVRDAMVKEVVTVHEDTTVGDLAHLIQVTEHMGYPVVDEKNNLVGIITHHDIHNALRDGKYELRVKDLETKKLILAHPQDTLENAMDKMAT
ncbi:MAG: chloride channel protein, partial [Thermoplasmata archaeon]|nr:chloride channel protein [Thermoplasmata archaeon]